MLNVALFISGRTLGYKDCLIPILKTLKTKYNIYLFLSINSEIEQEAIDLLQPAKYYFKKFFYDQDWIDNRVKNNRSYLGCYNPLSMFFNDHNNYLLIDDYEKENNIKFDIIGKIRPDMTFNNKEEIIFIKDDEDKLILRDVLPECPIKWYGNSPYLVSDTFCYGNKKSMKVYCNTYNWIKEKDVELKGEYDRFFESWLNENIFGCLFYNPTNKSQIFSYSECKDKMENNANNIKYITYNWKYNLLPQSIRSSINHLNQPDEHMINDQIYKWYNGGLQKV